MLLLWDRLVAYDSLELLAVLACGIFAFRAKSVRSLSHSRSRSRSLSLSSFASALLGVHVDVWFDLGGSSVGLSVLWGSSFLLRMNHGVRCGVRGMRLRDLGRFGRKMDYLCVCFCITSNIFVCMLCIGAGGQEPRGDQRGVSWIAWYQSCTLDPTHLVWGGKLLTSLIYSFLCWALYARWRLGDREFSFVVCACLWGHPCLQWVASPAFEIINNIRPFSLVGGVRTFILWILFFEIVNTLLWDQVFLGLGKFKT